MDQFTARSALWTGVDLIRRRPLLVLLWAVLQLALTILFAATFQAYMAWVSARYADGGGVANLDLLSGAYALSRAALSTVLSAVLWASAFRAILRPGTTPSLRLGGEELMVLVAQFVTQLIAALPVFVIQGVLFAAHGLTGLGAINRPIMTVFDVLGLFWSAVAAVWAFERLQIAPIRCWTIARSRFWLLAGLVVGVLMLRLLANVGVNQLAAALGHVFPPAITPRGYAFIAASPRLQDVFGAPTLMRDVMSAALHALEIAFLAGIVSSAYRTRPQALEAAAAVSSATGAAVS